MDQSDAAHNADQHDAFRSLRNAFYLGNWTEALNEARAVKADREHLADMADVFAMRTHVEQGNSQHVIDAIQDKTHGGGQDSATATATTDAAAAASRDTALQAVKSLALYRTANTDQARELVLETMRERLAHPTQGANPTLRLLAAQVHFEAADYKRAFEIIAPCAQAQGNIEKLALLAMIYLRIDRVDLAALVSKNMQEIDDDDVLSQLVACWIQMIRGGDKLTEATFALQELLEKFPPSVRVLNTLAACELVRGQFAQALPHLKAARELAFKTTINNSGSSSDSAPTEKQSVPSADTLVNAVVSLLHLHKSGSMMQELQSAFPNHPFLQRRKELEALFDQHAKNYAPAKKNTTNVQQEETEPASATVAAGSS